MVFHFRLISEKSNDKNFQKFHKTTFCGHFLSFLPKNWPMRNFLENQTPSVFSSYKVLQSSCNSEKASEPFLRKTDKQRDKTNGQS